MVYADYTYYKDTYFGNSINEEDFPRLALRSSQYIDYITRNKAKADMEAVKMACCAIAEQYQMIDAAQTLARKGLTESDSKEVQSETVGSWSKSYRSAGDSAQAVLGVKNSEQAGIYSIALQYLANTGLLYRGGGHCC